MVGIGMSRRVAVVWVAGLVWALFGAVPGVMSDAWAQVTVPIIESGMGDSRSFVQIDFTDGHSALFAVAFDGAVSATAFDLLTTLDNDPLLDFFLHSKTFVGLGEFVFGLGFQGSVNDDDDEDFAPGSWSLWFRDQGDESWASSSAGVSTTLANDGDWHGFTWGSFPDHPAPRPVPEPAAAGVWAAAVLVGVIRRGRPRRCQRFNGNQNS